MSGTAGMTPRIRAARAAEADAVASCVHRAYEKYVARIGRLPKPMLANYAHAIARHQVWVVEGEAALAAVLELIPQEDHLLIENVAVEPACQGGGLGRRLMDFAEEEGRRQGFRELRLYTNEKFVENIALYERLGYAETERQPYQESVVVFMRKAIAK
jgi:ribosomal protein S18 acetylase RimI-like enzyme